MRILGVGSSVEKVPGVPGWEQLICGSVIIKCHFLKQGFPCRELTAVTEQKYSSENSKLPHRSEIVVLSPFLLQSSSSVLICTYLFLLEEKNNLQPPDNCFG